MEVRASPLCKIVAPSGVFLPLSRFGASGASPGSKGEGPRIVLLPALTQAALRPIGSGTESSPSAAQRSHPDRLTVPGNDFSAALSPQGNVGSSVAEPAARIRFEPEDVSLKVGQVASADVVVDKVRDLFAVPLLVQYDPQRSVSKKGTPIRRGAGGRDYSRCRQSGGEYEKPPNRNEPRPLRRR